MAQNKDSWYHGQHFANESVINKMSVNIHLRHPLGHGIFGYYTMFAGLKSVLTMHIYLRKFVWVIIPLLAMGSCKKDESLTAEEQLEIDRQIIKDYLSDNGLTAQETSSGLHYIINTVGTGEHPNADDTVEVKYKGYLTNGNVFDQTQPARTYIAPLQTLIPGWIEGIPLLKSEGGEGTLLIPSYLGYGTTDLGSIPPNSVLIFDITLIDIK